MSQAGVDRLDMVVKEVGRIVFFLHLCFTCESLHVRAVCIWHCEHTQFCVEFVFMHCIYINFHSFIHHMHHIFLPLLGVGSFSEDGWSGGGGGGLIQKKAEKQN